MSDKLSEIAKRHADNVGALYEAKRACGVSMKELEEAILEAKGGSAPLDRDERIDVLIGNTTVSLLPGNCRPKLVLKQHEVIG